MLMHSFIPSADARPHIGSMLEFSKSQISTIMLTSGRVNACPAKRNLLLVVDEVRVDEAVSAG